MPRTDSDMRHRPRQLQTGPVAERLNIGACPRLMLHACSVQAGSHRRNTLCRWWSAPQSAVMGNTRRHLTPDRDKRKPADKTRAFLRQHTGCRHTIIPPDVEKQCRCRHTVVRYCSVGRFNRRHGRVYIKRKGKDVQERLLCNKESARRISDSEVVIFNPMTVL